MIEVNMESPNGVTLATAGKYCPDNVKVTPTFPFAQNVKRWVVNVPTAVARVYTTVVSGDPDVAAHYADSTAVCTVTKLTNCDVNGIYQIITQNNPDSLSAEATTTQVMGWDAAGAVSATATNTIALSDTGVSAGRYSINATASGDIKVMAGSIKTNFGGADYLITFAWGQDTPVEETMKRWTVTLTGASPSVNGVFVTDPWLAEHRNDEGLNVYVEKTSGDTTSDGLGLCAYVTNRNFFCDGGTSVNYGIRRVAKRGAVTFTSPVKEVTTKACSVNVDSNGALNYINGTAVHYSNGTYAIIAWLA